MQTLQSTPRKWLKCAHLFFGCLWGGGAAAMLLVALLFDPSRTGSLHARDMCMRLIDDWVVATGALGCLATGALFSGLTPWGFLRHRWIVLKWMVNLGFILFGLFFFLPLLDAMVRASGIQGRSALADPAYARNALFHLLSTLVMLGSLALVVCLSVFKPTLGQDRREKGRGRVP